MAASRRLEGAGVKVVETDLGEYILQLAKEPPSHIIAPVIHKGREEIADLFAEKHRLPRQSEPAALTREAREQLRGHFLTADMGISSGNIKATRGLAPCGHQPSMPFLANRVTIG